MEQKIEIACLLDFYGPLLTESRREILRLYLDEDLSLGEIAEQMGVTRQAVADQVARSREKLRFYEAKLGLFARWRAVTDAARKCLAALDKKDERAMREALDNILRIER